VGGVDDRLVDEQDGQLREAQAAEHEAKAKVAESFASLRAARAAVREAEALRDITRAELRIAANAGKPPAPADAHTGWKEAQSRFREARLDRDRAERDAARAETDRVEANQKKAKAAVEYRTKQVERFRRLLDLGSIEKRVFDEKGEALTEARDAERDAEMTIGLARNRLKAAEARLKFAEAAAANRP
jgi:hypothetical protein